MPSRSFVLAVVFVALAVPFAGCLKAADSEPVDDTPIDTANTSTSPTLPDDRGESAGLKETNKTEEGVGGVDHKHDYWKGAERVVVFEDDVFFSFLPVFPDGEGNGAKSVAYIKLPQPELIYEGAVEVQVLVSPPQIMEGTASPIPPTLTLSYRTASDEAFRAPMPVTYDAPTSLPVASRETDMPHSVSSLWAFRLATDRPEYTGESHVVITAIKGQQVVDWPGHPDFYADKTERIVLDKHVSVHRSGIDEFALYGAGSSWVSPDNLISYGTGYVDVFVNITSAVAGNGAEPTGFFLEYHNATILDAEDEYNDRIDDEEGGRAFEDAYYHFVVPVEAEGMDGPYQPTSRWGFRPVATFAETPVASLCPGCFPYDIEYDIKIVAHKGDDAARING